MERLLVEEASKAAGRLPGLWAEPPPSAQLVTGFGGSPLEFSLAVSIRDYADQHLIQHELRKQILARLKEEGVESPGPHQVVYLRGEATFAGRGADTLS